MQRKETRRIAIGDRFIGGGAPILVQSMTNKPASDFEGTLHQIRTLADAGCDIVRVTVPNREAVRCLYRLKENAPHCFSLKKAGRKATHQYGCGLW